MKKEYRTLLKKHGIHPIFYIVAHERDNYLIVRNWITGVHWHIYK